MSTAPIHHLRFPNHKQQDTWSKSNYYTKIMNVFSDSGELYTIRNEFFTNQHRKILSYSLDLFSDETKLKVLEFKIRSAVSLGEDASLMIEEGRFLFPGNDEIFNALQLWNDLKTFGTDESTYFDDVKEAKFELQAVLTAFYMVKFHGDYDLAISLLVNFNNQNPNNLHELEPYLVLIQLYLIQENYTEAKKLYQSFQKFPPSSRDSIIYQVLESWMLSIQGGSDNISNSYYFYYELLSTEFENDLQGKFHILSVLFALTLQMKHYPEAQELADQIATLGYEGPQQADYIANQIAFDYLTKDGDNVGALLKQLYQSNPEHHLLKDLKAKNDNFNEIIAKYQAA